MLPLVDEEFRGENHGQNATHRHDGGEHKKETQTREQICEPELGCRGEGRQFFLLPTKVLENPNCGE